MAARVEQSLDRHAAPDVAIERLVHDRVPAPAERTTELVAFVAEAIGELELVESFE